MTRRQRYAGLRHRIVEVSEMPLDATESKLRDLAWMHLNDGLAGAPANPTAHFDWCEASLRVLEKYRRGDIAPSNHSTSHSN